MNCIKIGHRSFSYECSLIQPNSCVRLFSFFLSKFIALACGDASDTFKSWLLFTKCQLFSSVEHFFFSLFSENFLCFGKQPCTWTSLFFFLPCRSLCKSVIISLRVVRLKWLLGEYFQLIREFQFFLRSIFHWSVFTKHKVVMQKVHFTAKVWRFYCLSVTHKP